MHQLISRYKFLENPGCCALFLPPWSLHAQLLAAALGGRQLCPAPPAARLGDPRVGWVCYGSCLRGAAPDRRAGGCRQDRRWESSRLGWEMLRVDTKPSEPNTARPHPCTHTCTAQKVVSWKQTKVSGDPLEVTLSTKITNTIDNSTKPSAFKMSSKTLPVPDMYQYAILSKSWFIRIFPQNYSEQSLSTGVEAELKGWFCLGSWIWGEFFVCFFSHKSTQAWF